MRTVKKTQAASTRCALCAKLRTVGRLSHIEVLGCEKVVEWVCQDCLNKLARNVDDEGARGW